MKHANISFFIPHVGCPKACSFCNQWAITGAEELPTPAHVQAVCQKQLEENKHLTPSHTEIAFFGGSFTAIEEGYMHALLAAAAPFVKAKQVKGIRISTRPDAVSKDTLALLKSYGVTAIELGAQSMDEQVLCANKRGHTAAQVVQASRLIQQEGISLGLQMMMGLQGDTPEKSLQTARALIALRPDTVRIYPTLVMKNTALAKWYQKGEYTPFSLEDTIALCAQLLSMFEQAGIAVIKLGLHPDKDMQENMLAGPFHPAFRQLVESRRCLGQIGDLLEGKPKGSYIILVPKGKISNFVGNRRENIERLQKQGYEIKIKESKKPLVKPCIIM